MKEEWRPVVGHEGSYEVSNLGRVKSFRRDPHGVVMKGGCTNKGYRRLTLSPDQKDVQRHVLVLEAFVGPRPTSWSGWSDGGMFIDGDKLNCRADNLAWETSKDRGVHKSALGTLARGERHPRNKLTEMQVRVIRRLVLLGMKVIDIQNTWGIPQTTVSSVKCGSSWGWLPRPINLTKVIPSDDNICTNVDNHHALC